MVSFRVGCQRSAALHPCPSARPGGGKCKGRVAEGDHPVCTSPFPHRPCVRTPGAEDRGYGARSLARARGRRPLSCGPLRRALPHSLTSDRPSSGALRGVPARRGGGERSALARAGRRQGKAFPSNPSTVNFLAASWRCGRNGPGRDAAGHVGADRSDRSCRECL